MDKSRVRCPRCNSKTKPAININNGESTFWVKCVNEACNTYIDTYIPQPHQALIHEDNHRFIGVFGGYGSGKTCCTLKDDQKHIFMTPNGLTVVGSAVLDQVQITYEKDFRDDMPRDLIASKNEQKKIYTFYNGHKLLIKSYYDEELLRSLNCTRFHIVEASAVDYDIFVQLQARLRNTAAVKGNKDWRLGIIESNPSNGWIRDEFLLKSGSINTHDDNQKYLITEPNPSFSSHIIPTKLNKFLPSDFEETISRGKADWWINRYLRGSFDYAEGMVYPRFLSSVIEPFAVPEEWVRIIAMDYGINDHTCFLFGAIDETNGVLYIIHEIYVNDTNYKGLAELYKQDYKVYVPRNKLYRQPVMDARSMSKRNDFNMKKIGELFAEEKIYFSPAQMDLDARITRTNGFIELSKVKVFNTCKNLVREGQNYKFPERTADGKSRGDKPIDKNNHAVNALEFMIMELPESLKTLQYDGYHSDGSIMNYKSSEENVNKRMKQINVYCPWDTGADKKQHGTSSYENLYNGIWGIGSYD